MLKHQHHRPLRQLEGFKRISLKAGESREVEFILDSRQFPIIRKTGKRLIEPGYFIVSVGGKQPGFNDKPDNLSADVLTAKIRLTGKEIFFKD